jgi:hypothetical protein
MRSVSAKPAGSEYICMLFLHLQMVSYELFETLNDMMTRAHLARACHFLILLIVSILGIRKWCH